MSRVMNIDVLMNFVCSASLLSKNLFARPNDCFPENVNSLIYSRKIFSASEICLIPGCIKKDSGQSIEMSVNIGHLASILNISSDYDFCLTSGCAKAAVEILSNLDQSVEPCDDFYQFACGGWLNRHEVSDFKHYISIAKEIEGDIELKLRDLLENRMTENESKYISDLKSSYEKCKENGGPRGFKKAEKIHSSGKAYKENWQNVSEVVKTLGGWPVLEGENWNSSSFDWLQTLVQLCKMGMNRDIFIRLYATNDVNSNIVPVVKLDQVMPEISNKTNFFNGENNSSIDIYLESMVKVAHQLNGNINTSMDEFRDVVNFEMTLAELSSPPQETPNISNANTNYTLQELMDEVPQINWIKYFSGLLNGKIKNETLVILDKNFIANFADLITKANKRVVANYMMWKIVQQLSGNWKIPKHRSRRRHIYPLWKRCLYSLMDGEQFSLSSYFMEQYFKKETKDNILKIFKYVHNEFLNMIEEKEWLDEETKRLAKEKAYAMKLYIGNPKDPQSFIFVSDLYKNLTGINLDRLAKESSGFIGEERNTTMETFGASAIYSQDENAIEMPAAYLQHPNFNKDRPQYLNFAAIGFIIGHEISHAFDDEGRYFDKHGNNVDWFSKKAAENFEEKVKCLIEQYDNYTDTYGRKVDGKLKQGENIADNGGLNAAYRAYQTWVKDHKSEGKLPGLKNYTQDQLFFISTASVMCEKYTDVVTHKGDHAPDGVRTIGMMSNMPEFSEAFQCSEDSAMNRKNKCRVW